MAFGEVSAGFKAWGDPTNVRDLAAGLGQSATQFGGTNGATQILMLDGSVRTLTDNVAPSVLKALATPAGGEVIGDF